MLACVSEDFVNEHTTVDARSRVGRAAYAAALPGFLADFDGLRYEPEVVIADGENVAVPYLMSFRHVPSGSVPVQVRGVFVFTLDPPEHGGLIARRVDYWDSGQVREQLNR